MTRLEREDAPRRLDRLDVVAYRWGTKYTSHDVNVLAAMVARHLTLQHTMHCVTDDPSGLDGRIVAHELPDEGVEGIWRKLGTFRRDFLGLGGRHVVSFDLDVVIVGSLDFLAEEPQIDLWIGRNWARAATSSRASGAVYRLRVGALAHVWERFIADPAAAIEAHHGKTRLIGEQNWLQHTVGEFDFLPDGKVVSFKKHCHARAPRLAGLSAARFGIARPPAGAAVVSFHGDPMPRDVRDGPCGPWRRAPFVAEHWRL
ncbi:hypothetical protein [Acuticoccus sp.]|uniref:hypothetical protein n=1 Tax=Acuticoccus sp. TaxID=1904378 RepID=UPI003B515551